MSWKQRKQVTAGLKRIYGAAILDEAEQAMEDIAKRLHISLKIGYVHRRNIFRKLEVSSLAALIRRYGIVQRRMRLRRDPAFDGKLSAPARGGPGRQGDYADDACREPMLPFPPGGNVLNQPLDSSAFVPDAALPPASMQAGLRRNDGEVNRYILFLLTIATSQRDS